MCIPSNVIMRWLFVLSIFALSACSDTSPTVQLETKTVPIVPSTEIMPEVERFPDRTVFFGDLHVHTSWSTDAYAGMNRVGPEDAHRFARGESVMLPGNIETQLDVPLDFVAITDHAEGFDAIAACTYEAHPQYNSDMCKNMRNPKQTQADYLRLAFKRGTARPAERHPDLCADEQACLNGAGATWKRVQSVANQFNEPGKFTALIGYEFSSLLPDFGMLHRNVIFRGDQVIPHAISSLDVVGQADFFKQLDANCAAPCEVLTIPHNTNYSWGLTFSRTDEDGSAYAVEDIERRTRLDRLVEVSQQKGTSECQFGIGASDEDCNFGILFEPCAEGQFGRCARDTSFVRDALLDGIKISSEGNNNPFKLGMIGSTDTHRSDPGNTDPVQPSRYAAAMGNKVAVERTLKAVHPVVGPMRLTGNGGLAAVWAQTNTRDDIFDALQRREAFATSGSRMKIRFFAGNFPDDILTRSDSIMVSYANGVPMGGDLNELAKPDFWVSAQQDPNGAKLDRIQVIKGWVENGQTKQLVRDVVCSDGRAPDTAGKCSATSASVDLTTCVADKDIGASTLATMFHDPDYDPSQWAFYYVRVLENPSCRWTTTLANSVGTEPPADVPKTEQQRGWSSPIWVSSSKSQ